MTVDEQDARKRVALEEFCRQLALRLAPQVPKGYGYAIVVFDLAHGGNASYMSNATLPRFRRVMAAILEATAPRRH